MLSSMAVEDFPGLLFYFGAFGVGCWAPMLAFTVVPPLARWRRCRLAGCTIAEPGVGAGGHRDHQQHHVRLLTVPPNLAQRDGDVSIVGASQVVPRSVPRLLSVPRSRPSLMRSAPLG